MAQNDPNQLFRNTSIPCRDMLQVSCHIYRRSLLIGLRSIAREPRNFRHDVPSQLEPSHRPTWHFRAKFNTLNGPSTSQLRSRPTTNNFRTSTPDARPDQDEEIRSFKVYVVNADGKLSEPVLLRDALADRKVDEQGRYLEILRQVQPPSSSRMFPVVKYFEVQGIREKELAQKKAERLEKSIKMQTKKLELNWTIGANDLEHRMDRLKEFLLKGRMVEITLGSRRKKGWQRKRPDNMESARHLISSIKTTALEIQGVKEKQAMTGEIGGLVQLYFEGPRQSLIETESA